MKFLAKVSAWFLLFVLLVIAIVLLPTAVVSDLLGLVANGISWVVCGIYSLINDAVIELSYITKG